MTGKPLDEVTDEERTNAKCVNFGVMYGMGAEALTQYAWKNYGLVIDVDTAKQWLWQWGEKYAGYIAWRRWHLRTVRSLRAESSSDDNAALGRRPRLSLGMDRRRWPRAEI